ncbi:Frizzled-7-A [Halotydeus destructor]|nr:Frizzled-7-A [Halotydeus destructor]
MSLRYSLEERNSRTVCLKLLSVLVVLFAHLHNSLAHSSASAAAAPEKPAGKCEEITIPMCRGIGYNYTSVPNMFLHDTQEEAGLEVHQFWPLVEISCSDDLRFFLCSVYAPICIEDYEGTLPACRSVCERARYGCAPIMTQYGFNWPERMKCEELPDFGDPQKLCMDAKEGAGPAGQSKGKEVAPRPVAPPVNEFSPSIASPKKPNMPPKKAPTVHPAPKKTIPSTMVSILGSYTFTCPLQLQTPPGLDYVFRINGKGYKNCAAPCDGVLFRQEERQSIRIWAGMWAVVCVVSALFTVLTFSIDTSRFKYPERPIISLSFCYLCIGLVYSIGFFLQDKVACNEPFPLPNEHSHLQAVPTVAQGNKKENCTLLFMALYFFTISSSVWWVILTFTWFLAAGLKWSHEAIENKGHVLHMFGWVVPAVMTITVLALGKVEGDPLTGVCFVGVLNQQDLQYFVFYPLLVCLVVGFLFLTAGFVSLWRLRTIMKMDGTKTDKLEKLMLRIGFFSILYMCPACILLACYYYEHSSLESWLFTWLMEICQRKEYGITCPFVGEATFDRPSKPYLSLYLLKYVATVMAGITSGFWIWSEKTVNSWSKFYARVLCCRSSDSRPGRRNPNFV